MQGLPVLLENICVDKVRTYTGGQRTYTDGQISKPATLDRLDSV